MKPSAYYNEIDPYAAAWLRNLISAGHIAPGDVDERSIEDVRPDDLRGYVQCHFFAGIGVWNHALRRAGWPDDRPVWTGSCPCQPFSAAGKGGGFADERHLWPAFFHFIGECRPPVVLGEQVASKDGLAWLDLVQADLEGTGYASGAVDLCAAGVGAPHIRQRLWWVGERVADPDGWERIGFADGEGRLVDGTAAGRFKGYREPATGVVDGGLDDDDDARLEGLGLGHRAAPGHRKGSLRPVAAAGEPGGLADADQAGQRFERSVRVQRPELHDADGRREDGWMADAAYGGRREERADAGGNVVGDGTQGQPARPGASGGDSRPGPTNGFWRDADWLFCRDGRWRPVEPGTFPLAHGASARVGRLRAYGNAIVVQAAQAFIEAYIESRVDRF